MLFLFAGMPPKKKGSKPKPGPEPELGEEPKPEPEPGKKITRKKWKCDVLAMSDSGSQKEPKHADKEPLHVVRTRGRPKRDDQHVEPKHADKKHKRLEPDSTLDVELHSGGGGDRRQARIFETNMDGKTNFPFYGLKVSTLESASIRNYNININKHNHGSQEAACYAVRSG